MSAQPKFTINNALLEKITSAPMEGISQELLRQHFDLYKGYVNNANALLKDIASGTVTGAALVDRRRRLGFEIDGVFMHELFFENITPANTEVPEPVKAFFAKHYGTYEKFAKEVEEAGATRGVGWVAVMYDCHTDLVTTTWVEEHHLGMLAQAQPLMLIDCWEHAFILDFKSTGRGAYVKTICKHIDWDVVSKRIESATKGQLVVRCVAH